MSWCVFLVVFWCRYCGWFSSRFSFRPSTRFPRFVPRLAFGPFCSFRSSPRSSLRFSFRPSFRLFVWACRKAVRLRRGVRLVACRGGVVWRLPCAPFLLARVRWCVWASRFSFRSSRLVSRLFCSFRRGERCVASLFSLASLVSVRHFARCLGWDAVAVWCRPVSRLVCRVGVGVSSLRLVSVFRAVGSMSASCVGGCLVSVLFCRAVLFSSISSIRIRGGGFVLMA